MTTLDKKTQEISRLELLIQEKEAMLNNYLLSGDMKALIRQDIRCFKDQIGEIKLSMNGPADDARVLKIAVENGRLIRDMKLENVPEDLFMTSEESQRIGDCYAELIRKGGVRVAGVVYVVVPAQRKGGVS